MTAPSVLVVGAGITGCVTSAALAGRGADVALIEPSPTWPAAAGGVFLPGTALAVLREIGALDATLAHACPVDSVRLCDASGSMISAVEVPRTGPDELPVAVCARDGDLRTALQTALRSLGVEVRLGTELLGCTDIDSHVEAELSDGHVENFDVIVAADGPHRDATRATLGVRGRPSTTGVTLLRAVAPGSLADGIPTVCAVGGRTLTLAPVADDALGVWAFDTVPVAGEDPPAAAYLRRLLREAGGDAALLADGIPDDLAVSVSPVERRLADAVRHRGRVVALGHAEHDIPAPFAQALAQAMEDAVVLATALTDGGDTRAMLAEFEDRRGPRHEPLVDAARNTAGGTADPVEAAWARAGRALRFLTPVE